MNPADQPRKNIIYSETLQPMEPTVTKKLSTKHGELFESFADETTLHGASYVAGANRRLWVRILYAIVLLTAIAACLYYVVLSFLAYFAYGTKTTMSFSTIGTTDSDISEFPSITFCNAGIYARSVVGAFPRFYVPSFMNGAYNVSIAEAMKICSPTSDPVKWDAFVAMLQSVNMTTADFSAQPMELILRAGIADGMRVLSYDSTDSVLACSWTTNASLQCNESFLNHMTDWGWCFTFNPSVNLLSQYVVNTSSVNATAYGMTPATRKPFPIVNSGWRNGLVMLLNAHQDDSCNPTVGTAGFIASVHDPVIQPQFHLISPTLLSPGYFVNMEIIVAQTIRNTANLGYCTSQMSLRLYPSLTKYFRDACYSNCITMAIYKQCGCLPYYAPPDAPWQLSSPNGSYPTMCWFVASNVNGVNLCSSGVEQQYFHAVPQATFCPECTVPCEETTYTVSTTSQLFPAINELDYYVETYALMMANGTGNLRVPMDLETFRRNVMLVNAYISSMEYSTITEDQAIMPNDLVNGIGGAIALFLGASVITFVEISVWVLGHIRYAICPCI